MRSSRLEPGADPVLLVLQQLSHLRLTTAVPEADVSGIVPGARLEFKVPAWPERTYSGNVARIARVLDEKSRTMPVELDVIGPCVSRKAWSAMSRPVPLPSGTPKIVGKPFVSIPT